MSMPLRFTIVPNRLDGWRPNRAWTRPGTGQVIVPARSRALGGDRHGRCAALGGQHRHRLLEPIAGRGQLTDQLGVQVAALADVGEQALLDAGVLGERGFFAGQALRQHVQRVAFRWRRATSAAREARSSVKRSSCSRSRRARTATTRAARSKVRASSSEKSRRS